MNKRKIGNIEVSAVGMGCMGFSHGYGAVPEREYSIEAIRKAYDYGCIFFDTAESYGTEQFYPGHNEELVGEAIEPFRDKVVLATKFHISDEEYKNDGLENIIRNHLKKSMEKLRTDYVDLYYLHRTNNNIPTEDIAVVMGKLIDEKLIRGWGLSMVDLDTLSKAHAITPVTAVQSIYSMVERGCEEEIIPFCEKNNIGFVPFSPTASGLLSGKVTKETKFGEDDVRKFVPQLSKENISANQPIIDMLKDYADKKNATPAQISLAWMIHKYPHVVPIPGSKNQERILENLKSDEVVLSEEEFRKLDDTLNTYTVYGYRGFVESEQSSFGNNWKDAVFKKK